MQIAPRGALCNTSTFIKLPFSIKTFVLPFFKWPLKTGFTIYAKSADIDQSDQCPHYLLSEYKLLKMGKSIHLKGANIAFMVAKGQGSE